MSRVELGNSYSLEKFGESFLRKADLELLWPASPHPFTVRLESSSSISNSDLSGCLSLIATTSSSDYAASSIGWHPKSKRKEMRLPDLRYLLLHSVEDSSALVGFASFMLTYEDGYEVIYLYEIHLCTSLRGSGLGKKLMGVVEEIGKRAQVEKCMLTVFVNNKGARSFYSALGYGVDEFSPEPRTLRNGVVKEPDYVILSKNFEKDASSLD